MATTLTTGRARGRRRWLKIHLGRVSVFPDVKLVTMISSNDTANRPKNRNRFTAKAAALPRTRAMVVAPSPAFSEFSRAVRTSSLCQASVNHRVVNPGGGHTCPRDGLKAYTNTMASGLYRK